MHRLGLFIVSAEDEYHRLLADQTRAVAQKHGVSLDVFSADDTPGKQASEILRFVSQASEASPALLVVPLSDVHEGSSIDTEPFYRLARRVLEKGASWVTLNHGDPAVTHALRREFPDRTVAMVTIDNREFGRLQALQLGTLVPRGGRVLYIVGNPQDSATQERRRGLLQAIDTRRFDIEEIDGWWRPPVAEDNVERWVLSPARRDTPVSAIVSQDDEMALAARRALARAASRLGRVELAGLPTIGGDGLPERGARWVDEGKLDATVRVTLPGAPAVEMLVEHWRSGMPLAPVTQLTPVAYPLPSELRTGPRATALPQGPPALRLEPPVNPWTTSRTE